MASTQTPQEVEDLLKSGPKTPAIANVYEQETDYTDGKISISIRLEYLKTLRQNNIERKKYAGRIFIFTCIWAVLIFLVVFLVGFKVVVLSDTVLVTLISTTTINFFGFFLLVVKYLFNTGAGDQDLPKG